MIISEISGNTLIFIGTQIIKKKETKNDTNKETIKTNKQPRNQTNTFPNKQTKNLKDQLWGGKCVDRVHSEPR